MSVTPADLAKPAEVSDADAKSYYAQHKAQYGRPEKREVRQITFQKPEEAASRARENHRKAKASATSPRRAA